mgnify:CR=1 FL=1
MKLRGIVTCVLLALTVCAGAQEFFNLTADEVKIDSVLPSFVYERELGTAYADSVYSVSIDYPEFIDMSATDVGRYQKITDRELPELPEVHHYIGVSRRRGTLYVSFLPLVYRDGKYQKLVSFMLRVKSEARRVRRAPDQDGGAAQAGGGLTRADGTEMISGRYAEHSVLASGTWAKIRVPQTGVYQLTDALVRKAGFSDLSKVKVYGYGGAVQPEKLTGDYLTATDDLKEVATCTVGGRRLFFAEGTVGWESNTSAARTRNPYSDYGYYFLTTDGTDPLTVEPETFTASFHPSPYYYHSLYEVDNYSWFHGGSNLYDSELLTTAGRAYELTSAATTGWLTVSMSYDGPCEADVLVNGTSVGRVAALGGIDRYSKAAVDLWTFSVSNLAVGSNTVTLRQTSGSNMRLDYLSLCFSQPSSLPDLATSTFAVPEYVYNITNQDHHADGAVDMVIIIPTSQKLLAQAERLKTFHETHDQLRVRIVPADELYNEFSSGTPDANAYRRYLKMLYDRAATDDDMPRYLLLFGDGAWDNRMLTADWKNYSPDDFLLCYESDNSFSETDCYVSDDYFCVLDDNEGGNLVGNISGADKSDVAVGRFPVRTAIEARTLVDKTINYMSNNYAGGWQNTICFMGDDGNYNMHMQDAEAVAGMIQDKYPAYSIKKIYWDAYTRQASSTGFSYPDVTRLIKQQMKNGALIMNYTGHGAPYCVSHEMVVRLSDFAEATSQRLPLWLTASCDIMPFDGQEDNIGETAMLNKYGGAIAFYGTTRTVYSNYNRYMNLAFTEYVLGTDANGRRYTVGEAARLAKNRLLTTNNGIGTDYTANKLQYTLLGDPALTLAAPTANIVVDEINGQPATSKELIPLSAGQTVTVTGHIDGITDFDGTVTATVRDVEQTIVCKMNNEAETSEAFTFSDRPNTLYSGTDNVTAGQFSFVFAVPKDISYADAPGLLTLYAVNSAKTIEAHGENYNFKMSGSQLADNDGVGPSIYCYLNSSSFINGGVVNTTPYFYAELEDKDGINASGNGIGHDLQLIIDGEMMRTYNLNDYFVYDFGNYRRGYVGFSIPQMAEGPHKLLFRAWDVLNNSSTAQLSFYVSRGTVVDIANISCTNNPASTSTRFIINHNRAGSEIDVELDIYDTSGRLLWKHTETGVATDNTYTVDWDLTVDGGRRLQTGVYLYRVAVSCEGSQQVSQARKIIVNLK